MDSPNKSSNDGLVDWQGLSHAIFIPRRIFASLTTPTGWAGRSAFIYGFGRLSLMTARKNFLAEFEAISSYSA